MSYGKDASPSGGTGRGCSSLLVIHSFEQAQQSIPEEYCDPNGKDYCRCYPIEFQHWGRGSHLQKSVVPPSDPMGLQTSDEPGYETMRASIL